MMSTVNNGDLENGVCILVGSGSFKNTKNASRLLTWLKEKVRATQHQYRRNDSIPSIPARGGAVADVLLLSALADAGCDDGICRRK